MAYKRQKYEDVTNKINNTKITWDHINGIRETREGVREIGYLRRRFKRGQGNSRHIEEV